MDDLQLLVDLHRGEKRQGPGGDAETRQAMELAGLDRSIPLKIVDIGCGTGASSLFLAQELQAKITAADLFPDFLQELEERSQALGVSEKIETLSCSMEALPFGEGEYDVIWSEGAIYNMGFKRGVENWKRFLRSGGVLAVSELTFFTSDRPSEVEAYWNREYPEADTASSKIAVLEESGFSLTAYFILPMHCWVENYYEPLQERFDKFLAEQNQSEAARALVQAERQEMDFYKRWHIYYGYGFYIAKKI